MTNTTLDARLSCAASFVRVGAVLADIGTDHGYLPIFLLSRGVIERAVLCDVNSGPLASARENVGAAGLLSRCEFVLTDGAAALDGRGITDYTVCGMGGELIADIIDRAPHLFDPAVRLILQPMTRVERLRPYLCSHGFEILEERYSFADGKYYVCLLVGFSGTPCEISDELAYLGADLVHEGDREEYLGYLQARKRSLERAYNGKLKSGEKDTKIEHILRLIDKRIEKHT